MQGAYSDDPLACQLAGTKTEKENEVEISDADVVLNCRSREAEKQSRVHVYSLCRRKENVVASLSSERLFDVVLDSKAVVGGLAKTLQDGGMIFPETRLPRDMLQLSMCLPEESLLVHGSLTYRP